MDKQKSWVDYRTIKNNVSMQTVLDRYGITLKKSGTSHVCCCPIHKGSNDRQFSVNLEKNIWQCFGDCKTGGNVLDFTAMMEFGDKKPASIYKAAVKLQDWFLAGDQNETDQSEAAETEETCESDTDEQPAEKLENPVNKPLTFELKNLDPDHEWFENRGILPDTVKHFGLGLQEKGKTIPNRIAIPIHDHSGQLVAYCGRAINNSQIKKEGKYKLPANFVKSEVVYNLHRQPKDAKALILVESFVSVWKLHQMGFPNTIAIMGSKMSPAQEKLVYGFLGPHKRLVCMFDADDAGINCLKDCLTRLIRKIYVKAIDISSYATKPHQLTSENLHACLCITK